MESECSRARECACMCGNVSQDNIIVCSRFQAPWILLTLALSTFNTVLYVVLHVLVRRRLNETRNVQSIYARNVQTQAKVTRVVGTVLLVYILFWVFPMVAMNIAFVLQLSPQILARIAQLITIGGTVSSAANIFIYSTRLPNFTKYMKKALRIKDNQVQSNQVIPMNNYMLEH